VHGSTRTRRSPGPWKWNRRQAPRVAHGAIGTPDRRGGATWIGGSCPNALVGDRHDRILGFTMIGAEAGEVMAVVHAAILADLPYPRLRDAVLAHPTTAEGTGFPALECAAPSQIGGPLHGRSSSDRL
jgi:hypothetical protein